MSAQCPDAVFFSSTSLSPANPVLVAFACGFAVAAGAAATALAVLLGAAAFGCAGATATLSGGAAPVGFGFADALGDTGAACVGDAGVKAPGGGETTPSFPSTVRSLAASAVSVCFLP